MLPAFRQTTCSMHHMHHMHHIHPLQEVIAPFVLFRTLQVLYAGRQQGGKLSSRPNSAAVRNTAAERARTGLALQPTEPELLADAQKWVKSWPDAVGQTAMMNAFQLADQHWACDCW